MLNYVPCSHCGFMLPPDFISPEKSICIPCERGLRIPSIFTRRPMIEPATVIPSFGSKQ